MKPIGPLMWEHRLIERMIALLKEELKQIDEKTKVDGEFLEIAIDFIRTYADRTHHGKEEDILFRELSKKQLLPEHKNIMNELIAEHISGRKLVTKLVNARETYRDGRKESLSDIVLCIKELVSFYPAHIEKEDKHFFYPILEYLSKQEQDNMLQEFWEFDRKLIHKRYEGIVAGLEKGKV